MTEKGTYFVVVFGVGAEIMIWEPRKFEESSNGFDDVVAIEAL